MSKRKYIIIAKCYDKRGFLLSVGFNSYEKTHPLQKHFAEQAGVPEKQFLHAEISAILRAKDKKIHKITIERFDLNGNPVNAAPCPICQRAIQTFGISVVEHT